MLLFCSLKALAVVTAGATYGLGVGDDIISLSLGIDSFTGLDGLFVSVDPDAKVLVHCVQGRSRSVALP